MIRHSCLAGLLRPLALTVPSLSFSMHPPSALSGLVPAVGIPPGRPAAPRPAVPEPAITPRTDLNLSAAAGAREQPVRFRWAAPCPEGRRGRVEVMKTHGTRAHSPLHPPARLEAGMTAPMVPYTRLPPYPRGFRQPSTVNKALRRTAIPMRIVAAGELGRSAISEGDSSHARVRGQTPHH